MSENKSTTNLPQVTIFQEMEKFDEMQITNPDLISKLAYKNDKSGKVELTYAGVKHLILMMSQTEDPQAMEIVEKKIYFEETNSTWYAEVVLRNKKTGHETWGLSENQAYGDQFARTKAASKAMRNAERAQLPEMLITNFIEKLDETKIQKGTPQEKMEDQRDLKNKGKSCDCDVPFFGKTEPKTCIKCGGSG